MKKIELKPIGTIHSPFKQAEGTPIQPAFAKAAEGVVEIFDEYIEGLKDLDGFERIWLIYWFDRSKAFELLVTPYMDKQKRGLFATRAPSRPNSIGISSVKLQQIKGNKLYVSELDILDGTPLLDIKPYAPKFDHFDAAHIGWLENVNTDRHTADDRFHK
jgi:tRNA (adenine37-N6)-methyltransferase